MDANTINQIVGLAHNATALALQQISARNQVSMAIGAPPMQAAPNSATHESQPNHSAVQDDELRRRGLRDTRPEMSSEAEQPCTYSWHLSSIFRVSEIQL